MFSFIGIYLKRNALKQNSTEILVLDKTYIIKGISDIDPYISSIGIDSEWLFKEFVNNFIRDNSVAIDVGANIGIISIILSKFLSRGRVYSIEAGPNIYELLKYNINNNKIDNVSMHNFAVSNTNGVVNFVENSAYGYISNKSKNTISVQCITLDTFINKYSIHNVDFIKIDVEGLEQM